MSYNVEEALTKPIIEGISENLLHKLASRLVCQI